MGYGFIGPTNQVQWNRWHLDAFWKEVQGPRSAHNSAYILLLLKEFAERAIPRYCFRKKSYAKARRTKSIIALRARKHHSTCFCCFKRIYNATLAKTAVIHHVLLIKNGGLDLKDNRVVLCHGCHAEVHPWLKDTSQGEKESEYVEKKKFESAMNSECGEVTK